MVYGYEEEKRSESSFQNDEIVFTPTPAAAAAEGRPVAPTSTPGAFTIASGHAADEGVLFKHGVSPTSVVFSKDVDEESVPSSHIGSILDVNLRDKSDGSPGNSPSRFGVRRVKSQWDDTPKEKRKRYALLTLVGVLFIVVIAMTAVMAVGAKKGRENAEKYSAQYANGAQGPPAGVDVSGYAGEGEGGPPPGLAVEGNDEQSGPPPDVDIPEEQGAPPGGAEAEGINNEADNDQQQLQQQQGTSEVDTEEGSNNNDENDPLNWVQGMIGAFMGGQDEEGSTTSVTITTTSTPPTSSPTSKTPLDDSNEGGDDSEDDELDTWSALYADGACFDGFAEIWCCATTFCSDSLRQTP